MTNPEQEIERPRWPRGTLRLYPLLCELSWVFNIGEAPSGSTEGRGEAPPQELERETVLGPDGPELRSGLDPRVARLLSGVDVPTALMRKAVPGFVAFRREFETLGLAHRDVCLHAFEATRVDSTASLPRQRSGLLAFSEGVQMALARWKLAPSAGSSPIVGPFVAALVRGVYAGRSGPFPTLHGLRIVPGVDGGNLLSVLAYGHGVDRGDSAIGTAEALGLRPSPIGPGRLVDQPQLIDARLWTLRRIGGIPVKELASWQGVGRQRMDHMLRAMDRALNNKLPHERPTAAGY